MVRYEYLILLNFFLQKEEIPWPKSLTASAWRH